MVCIIMVLYFLFISYVNVLVWSLFKLNGDMDICRSQVILLSKQPKHLISTTLNSLAQNS